MKKIKHTKTDIISEKSANRLALFFKTEAASGIVLMLVTALAIFMANINVTIPLYTAAAHALHLPVNDGLMVVFFFLIGLEIKREVIGGVLSSRAQAMLPVVAGICGMAVPALIFAAITQNNPSVSHGWAIPSATDIAFALGILSLAGPRVPASVRLLLLAIAVIDDLGAILIIALFYSASLDAAYLGGAALLVAAMVALKRRGIAAEAAYIALGILLAVALYKGGIHTTIAGVIAAFFIPAARTDRLIHKLHMPVAFAIMPLFAFVNAGLSLRGLDFRTLLDPLPFAIIIGLFIGKPAGIFISSWVAVKSGIARMPEQATWRHIYGMSILCGIGFTMSLFIGTLAYGGDADAVEQTRLGVLAGSLLSSVAGFIFLRFFGSNQK